jgi:hypothetical protein
MNCDSPHPGRVLVFRFGLLLTLTGLLATGCFKVRPPTPTREAALATLRAALEAWQKGEKPDVPGQVGQGISLSDPDWSGGARLAKFEIDEDRVLQTGYDLKFPVKLWLGDGQEDPRSVKFTIVTSPARLVVRDFGG